jgi:hypothetical protein
MKKLLSIFILVIVINFVNAQVSKTINVTTAGTLWTMLTNTEFNSVTNLTITGNINEQDFSTITFRMSMLNILDISSVNILEYKEQGGYFRTFPANQIPGEFPWFPDNAGMRNPSQIILFTKMKN